MRAVMIRAYVGLAAMMLASAAARPAEAGAMTYIALGDSLAFGETDFNHNPSYGDRGYVASVADSLAAKNGGVRPEVVNLAVNGETSSSFFSGGQASMPLNLNYANTMTSQNAMLAAKIAEEKAAGNTIGAVTVSLGANDLFAVVGAPSFFAMNPAQQQSVILASMTAIQNNYTNLLTELHELAPDATVTLVGDYNPFAAVPGSPLAALAAPAVQLLNAVIAGQAAAFGATYVDTYTPFLHHEAEYTYITADPAGQNVHPNAAGYGAISNAINPVPEPSTTAVMALLGLGLLGRTLRRHKPAVAA